MPVTNTGYRGKIKQNNHTKQNNKKMYPARNRGSKRIWCGGPSMGNLSPNWSKDSLDHKEAPGKQGGGRRLVGGGAGWGK